jgi:hypothetical protein
MAGHGGPLAEEGGDGAGGRQRVMCSIAPRGSCGTCSSGWEHIGGTVDARRRNREAGRAAVCLPTENFDKQWPEWTLGKGGDARERALAEGRARAKD